ncbi:unnamed protein product [Leptosia nina]|uniref:Uncharacterized protein n=1 Tax=Leptosia nina TaxID=320188 RepID=A0AAV1J226_9NEOP
MSYYSLAKTIHQASIKSGIKPYLMHVLNMSLHFSDRSLRLYKEYIAITGYILVAGGSVGCIKWRAGGRHDIAITRGAMTNSRRRTAMETTFYFIPKSNCNNFDGLFYVETRKWLCT